MRAHGRDVLRPTPPGTRDPLATACFPLVPYANRIAHGRFAFGGAAHQLPLNFGVHPHSLHGQGWQSAWDVAHHDADTAVLEHRHDGSAGWPWAYSAEQRFVLDGDGLTVCLTLANRAARTMPAGLGLHPYFPVDDRTVIEFEADHLWLSDDTSLPVRRAPVAQLGNWGRGDLVGGRPLIDHAFEGWRGTATLTSAYGRTRLTAGGARDPHFYCPPDEHFVCLEPVSHLPDAFNRGDRYAVLQPGESATLSIRISTG